MSLSHYDSSTPLTGSGGSYQQQEAPISSSATLDDEESDLILDPSCSCCCACSRRGVGEKGTLCNWMSLLILFACLVFGLVAAAVIYSTNLVAHLLSLCTRTRALFIAIPILAGALWILGVVLMIRSFRHRREIHSQKLARGALVQDHSAQVSSLDGHAAVPAAKPRFTCRRVSRFCFSGWFWTLFILLNLFILIVFSTLLYFEIHTLPRNDGSMNMGSGKLHTQATISRSDKNILHIKSNDPNSAKNDDYDMFFTQGIAHAQERLWQMEFQRAVGAGKLTELVGNHESAIKIDKLSRTMGFYRKAQSAFPGLQPRTQSVIQAYCDGVNSYLENSALTLPIEFHVLGLSKPSTWQPADVVVWTKLVSYMLSGNIGMELSRWDLFVMLGLPWERVEELIPPFNPNIFPIILEGEIPPEDMNGHIYANDTTPEPMVEWLKNHPQGVEFNAKLEEIRAQTNNHTISNMQGVTSIMRNFRKVFGPSTASNNWVISGNRTRSGFPLMANDPHLQLMAPSIWILNHISSPSFFGMGASFVGVPGIIIGRNKNISWSVTNVGLDCQDVYIMDGNQTHYQWNNTWYAYITRQETLNVAHSDPITFTVREASQYGPVISDLGTALETYDISGGPALALRWTSLDDQDSTFDAFMNINSATNYDEWTDALKLYRAPSQNMIYADRSGNIGYYTTGVAPVRPYNITGKSPVPGNGTYDWIGYVPFTQMPNVKNPKKGYIATANNAVVPDGYRSYITGDWDEGDGFRAKRITEMITNLPKHDVATMAQIQTDVWSGLGAMFCKDIIPNLQPSTQDGQQIKANLLAWNHVASVGSLPAQQFERLYYKLTTLPKDSNSSRWTLEVMTTYYTFTGKGHDPNCQWNNGSMVSTNASIPSCIGWASQQLDAIAAEKDVRQDEWGVGGCHSAKYTHQILDNTPLQCMADRYVDHGGDVSTVNVGTISFNEDFYDEYDSMTQLHGASYRQIIDWSDVDSKSMFIYGPGQSGNMLSPSYDDLVAMWAEGSYLPMDPNEEIVNTLNINP